MGVRLARQGLKDLRLFPARRQRRDPRPRRRLAPSRARHRASARLGAQRIVDQIGDDALDSVPVAMYPHRGGRSLQGDLTTAPDREQGRVRHDSLGRRDEVDRFAKRRSRAAEPGRSQQLLDDIADAARVALRSFLKLGSSGASSRAPRIATGVLNSWAALAVKRRRRMASASRRSSAPLTASMKGRTSDGVWSL